MLLSKQNNNFEKESVIKKIKKNARIFRPKKSEQGKGSVKCKSLKRKNEKMDNIHILTRKAKPTIYNKMYILNL